MTKEIIGAITVLMVLGSYIPYVKGILENKFTPHPFSWIIWLVIDGIGIATQISDNAGPGVWMNIVLAFIMVMIITLSLKNGFQNIKRSDVIVFISALAAIPLWIITNDATFSVVLISLINAFAIIPTLRKSYTYPYQESVTFFTINASRHSVAMFALTNFSFITSFFAFTQIATNITLIIFLSWRRHAIKKELRT